MADQVPPQNTESQAGPEKPVDASATKEEKQFYDIIA